MTSAENKKHVSLPINTAATFTLQLFFLAQTANHISFIVVCDSCCVDGYFAITQPEDTATSTMDLLKEMKEQMATLTSKVETLQQKQASDASVMVQEEEDNEDEDLSGNLVSLSESMHAFLKATFSTTLANMDRKSGSVVLVCPTAIVFGAPN